MKVPSILLSLILLSCSCNPDSSAGLAFEERSWQEELEADLHLLGHRNWILVVDKAFPEQSSQGMKYLYADEDFLPTLKHVLDQIGSSSHVSPLVYTDKELNYIREEELPGVNQFRMEREKILANLEVRTLLHEDVFVLLDESSSLFKVLVIKTNFTLPYTSVFLQLECAYWDSEDEARLRARMTADDPG